jgi:hypothetical protein
VTLLVTIGQHLAETLAAGRDITNGAAVTSLTRKLAASPPLVFSIYAAGAAFATYFCMYGLRRPFAVGTWAGDPVWGLQLKTFFVMSQVLGYAVSKWIGVKVVSEAGSRRRSVAIVVAALTAELALVGFAATPAPWSAVFLVVNGLPLGMIWGLVFGYLEGRKVSDYLGAGLCASFILASGAVKAVGRWLLDAGVPEPWMPAVAGLLFLAPMLAFTALLAQLPPPTPEDEAARTKRAPMDAAARRAFLRQHLAGLAPLLVAYVALTAFRDFRDNFARELWDALGYSDAPSIFALAEIPVAFGALLPVLFVGPIRDNRRALWVIHGVMALGGLLVAASTGLWSAGVIGPAAWMICAGLGAYLAYVPYNCVLFDRLVAALGSVATAAFLIQLADSLGYVGSVGLIVYKNLGQAELPWVSFFALACYGTAAIGLCAWGASALWLRGRSADRRRAPGRS